MPPVLADDLGLVDFVNRPQPAVARLVQVNGLKHVVLKRHLFRKLSLVVRGVEAHLQPGQIGRVHLDVVHGAEVGFAELVAHGLVFAGQGGDRLGRVVEVLIMLFHVVGVVVGDGDVVGEFGGAEDSLLTPAGRVAQHALASVGQTAKDEFVIFLLPVGAGGGVAVIGVVAVGRRCALLWTDAHSRHERRDPCAKSRRRC